MRSNLLSLQSTGYLLDRTQTRLSTGKKVNSAIDNPVSYFAAQSLSSRASVIDSLKDAMGQAVSTINAADEGITSITSMIEQAKGIAQSALSAEPGVTVSTGAITLTGISAGGGYATGNLAVISVIEANVITFRLDSGGGLIGFQADPNPATAVNPPRYLLVEGDMNATASNLASAMNSRDYSGGAWKYTAQYNTGTNTMEILKYDINTGLQVNFAAADFGASNGSYSKSVNPVPSADQINIGGVTFTATSGATGGQNFHASGDNTADMGQLANAVNNYAWGDTAYTATVSNGKLNLSKTVDGISANVEAGDFDSSGVTNGGSANMTLGNTYIPSEEVESLQDQYNALRIQLNELAEDSGYKGKNLLSATASLRAMTVKFEGTTLTVNGFNATSSGLGITAATWASGSDINSDLNLLDYALITLRKQSSSMSSNLSIITTRQNFSTDMMNTLTTGADKLTLADTNEEGADMLMLQTRQSLGTTALSMSAQASQAVLKLFG